MVNNYPEYAAGVNYKKTDTNGNRHFYSAQVVADPANETVESKLIKDGVVIDEGGAEVEALNVTENGTYSEEGKAYSPVVVNVAGGASDFTTATVIFTVEESITEPFLINMVNVYGNDMFDSLDSTDIDPEGIEAVLYKGEAPVNVSQSYGVKIKEVSGAATRLDNLHAKITGNCTITFTIAST